MSEIRNLSAVCRCCHGDDGTLKRLDLPYMCGGEVEVYSLWLEETFGLTISEPPCAMSYSICETCIKTLRDSFKFKLQIISCERKFYEYLQNEQALTQTEVKNEVDHKNFKHEMSVATATILLEHYIKNEIEVESYNDNNGDTDLSDVEDDADVKNEDIKQETRENQETLCDDKKAIKKDICSLKATKRKKKLIGSKAKKCNVKKSQRKPKKVQDGTAPIKRRAKEWHCQECDILFKCKGHLNEHINVHHKYRGPYCCTDCTQEFDEPDSILEHVKSHDKTRAKCRFCEKEFAKKKSLIEHENSVHIRESFYVCDICNKKFYYKCTMRKHALWHSGLNKKFFCEICGHGFNDRTNLRSHVDAVHLNLRKFACTECDRTFKANKHLKSHLAAKHFGLQPYACKVCSEVLSDWKSFNRHKSIHSSTVANRRKYRCKGCPETFDNRGTFRSHVMKHNKEGTLPNICHICGISFSCKYSLNRHVDNHTGLKPHQCDSCDKSFSQKTMLIRHKNNVHNAVKKEKTKCPICNTNVRNPEKHKKVHELRPFTCDFCLKSYPQKNALNRHIKEIHLGIFKHGCTICHTRYKTAKLLEKHNRTCHNKRETDVLDYDNGASTDFDVDRK